MFLGISFNKWHMILAIIAVDLSFILLWYFLSDLLIPTLGLMLTAGLFFLFSTQFAHHLQCWNEIMQALSPDVENKYKNGDLTGFKGFQKDSRDDFRWFWLGISVSWIIPLIIILF